MVFEINQVMFILVKNNIFDCYQIYQMCVNGLYFVDFVFKIGQCVVKYWLVQWFVLLIWLVKMFFYCYFCYIGKVVCYQFLFMVKYINVQFVVILKNGVYGVIGINIYYYGGWCIGDGIDCCCGDIVVFGVICCGYDVDCCCQICYCIVKMQMLFIYLYENFLLCYFSSLFS